MATLQTVGQPARVSLSTAARRRGLITILIDTFLMWTGFFMVIPLISVHYVHALGWSAASIGIILGLRQLTQQGLTVAGGMIADRVGAKGLIVLGLLIRAIGFGAMAWATTFPLLLLATLLAATGGALFDSPRSAAVAALTDAKNRQQFYGLLGITSGLGLAIGPLLGSLLIKLDFRFVALSAAACFVLTVIITLIFLPPVQVASEEHHLTYGLMLALRDRPFVKFNAWLMGYWFMWVQISIALPLAAETLSGTSDGVSWIYGLNAALTIALQYPVVRLTAHRVPPLMMLIGGIGCMALGLGSVAFADTMPMLLVSVAIFSLGVVCVSPSQQTVTAMLANPAALGSYFGISSLSLAIGGAIGNYCGGLLYTLGQRTTPALPWLTFCAIGILTMIGLTWFYLSTRQLSEGTGLTAKTQKRGSF